MAARYTLEDFVHDMNALVSNKPDQAAIFDRGSAYLERLVSDADVLPERFAVPSGKGKRPNHGSYALYRGPGLFVSSVVWGPGDHVGPHDHHTWGMIGVIGNAIQETRYRKLDEHADDGIVRLERDRSTLVKPGEVTLLTPDLDEIHAMENSSGRCTVEVHVYGADLVGLDRCQYDLETGKVTHYASGPFDNC